MGRPRPSREERRIDAATDHLAQHGFAKPQIRKVINDLLQLYEVRDAWVFLEEDSYRVVRNKLVEEQAQQDQRQTAAAAECHGDAPNESQSALEVQASAKGPCAGSPCYGWINEASETESEPEDGEMLSDAGPVIFTKKDIPNYLETLPSKRK